MIAYPNIDPVAFSLGPLAVHWYGLMYLVGFALAWLLVCYRARQLHSWWDVSLVSDLLFYVALGVIIGGRVGYMLIYDLPELMQDPIKLFKVWQGGMSFHGGFCGVLIAVWLFSRKIKQPFVVITDFFVPVLPVGLAMGRIGNFINGELWGRATDVPWGMVFPFAGSMPRHPSQLYACFLEGVVLFIFLWFYSAKPKPPMAVSAMFVLGYAVVRFFDEFFRQPDLQFGFIAFDWLTMGQLLSIPMGILGVILLWVAYRRPYTDPYPIQKENA